MMNWVHWPMPRKPRLIAPAQQLTMCLPLSTRATNESPPWRPGLRRRRRGSDEQGRQVWNALTSIIKLEDKVIRQADAMRKQQEKLEDLTGRVIRLETQLELLTGATL